MRAVGYDTGMNDGDALLAAIIANPDDDTPRLVYADWLDENGDETRAEFIRVQCAPESDEFAKDRAAELEEWNRGKWLRGLPPHTTAHLEFRRGFPEFLRIDGELFLERYDAFARVPWLRFLWLYGLSPWDVRDLANQTWPPQWTELGFATIWSDDPSLRNGPAFAVLANSSQLSQLRCLTFSRGDLDLDCVRVIAASPYLHNLRQLRLHDHRDDREGDALLNPLRERFGDRLVIG